jgi:glycine betaine/proline transport system substrate-binding protein
MMKYLTKRLSLLLAMALLLPVLAACSTGGDDENQSVTIGWIPWDEDIAATYLWEHVLEEEGYDVELVQLDAGLVFQGMAQGDVDVFLDTWLPGTHAEYWEDYGDQLEDLGVWYDDAILAYAVPDYVDVQSIPALAENAELFDGQIVGIEPGAGMMGIARDTVNPGYGLADSLELVESSTPAMIAELDSATAAEEPIVVTMWQPHWAYEAYNLRNLEDPDNLWGDAEQLHVTAREGFSEEFPELTEWFGNFQMDNDALFSLEVLIVESDGDEAGAVDEWLENEENQQLVDSWITE